MPCNVIKDGKGCGKDTSYRGSIYDEHREVFVETETCEECYKKIQEAKKR